MAITAMAIMSNACSCRPAAIRNRCFATRPAAVGRRRRPGRRRGRAVAASARAGARRDAAPAPKVAAHRRPLVPAPTGSEQDAHYRGAARARPPRHLYRCHRRPHWAAHEGGDLRLADRRRRCCDGRADAGAPRRHAPAGRRAARTGSRCGARGRQGSRQHATRSPLPSPAPRNWNASRRRSRLERNCAAYSWRSTRSAMARLTVDGQPSQATGDAIRRFQLDNGLPVTGELNDKVIERLVSIGAMKAG